MSKLSGIMGESPLISCVPIRMYTIDGKKIEVIKLSFISFVNKEKPKTWFFTFDICRKDDNIDILSKTVNVTDGVSIPTLCSLEAEDYERIMIECKKMDMLYKYHLSQQEGHNDSISENNQE